MAQESFRALGTSTTTIRALSLAEKCHPGKKQSKKKPASLQAFPSIGSNYDVDNDNEVEVVFVVTPSGLTIGAALEGSEIAIITGTDQPARFKASRREIVFSDIRRFLT